MAFFQAVTVNGLHDRLQQRSELRGDGFKFSVQRISQEIVINVSDKMRQTFLLLTWKRIVSRVEIGHQNAFAADSYLPAAGLELALDAVPVQDKVGRRGAGEQRGDFFEVLPHFAGQCRGSHLEHGVVIAVHDFAKTNFASEHLGEDERIERQQQPVVLGELVAEDKTNGNELGRLAPAFRGHALDGVKTSFDGSSRRQEALTDFGRRSLSLVTSAATKFNLGRHVQSQPPLGSLQVFR